MVEGASASLCGRELRVSRHGGPRIRDRLGRVEARRSTPHLRAPQHLEPQLRAPLSRMSSTSMCVLRLPAECSSPPFLPLSSASPIARTHQVPADIQREFSEQVMKTLQNSTGSLDRINPPLNEVSQPIPFDPSPPLSHLNPPFNEVSQPSHFEI